MVDRLVLPLKEGRDRGRTRDAMMVRMFRTRNLCGLLVERRGAKDLVVAVFALEPASRIQSWTSNKTSQTPWTQIFLRSGRSSSPAALDPNVMSDTPLKSENTPMASFTFQQCSPTPAKDEDMPGYQGALFEAVDYDLEPQVRDTQKSGRKLMLSSN